MSQSLIALFFVLALAPVTSHSASSHGGLFPPKKFGLGVIAGVPTAITAKYWISRRSAFDAGVSYWFGDYVEVYADYLWHFAPVSIGDQKDPPQVITYIGIGADNRFDGRSSFVRGDDPVMRFSLRIPLGAEWLPEFPIGVFVEFVPAIRLNPGISGAAFGGIGIRYYF